VSKWNYRNRDGGSDLQFYLETAPMGWHWRCRGRRR